MIGKSVPRYNKLALDFMPLTRLIIIHLEFKDERMPDFKAVAGPGDSRYDYEDDLWAPFSPFRSPGDILCTIAKYIRRADPHTAVQLEKIADDLESDRLLDTLWNAYERLNVVATKMLHAAIDGDQETAAYLMDYGSSVLTYITETYRQYPEFLEIFHDEPFDGIPASLN